MIRAILTTAALLMVPGMGEYRAAAFAAQTIEAPGPQGALAGTFIDAGRGAPVVLIIPGSGLTDRDGNSPMGVTAGYLRQIAEGLAAQGVSSARVDKRGMFGSRAAQADANAVTVAAYADDVASWIRTLKARTGARCVWVLGHSEGALVALKAGQTQADICGLALIAGPGRKLGVVMREQFRANPANAPLLDALMKMMDELEAGRMIDADAMPPVLAGVFPPAVQPYLIDLLAQDPAALASRYTGPMLIVQGGRDIQVAQADADALKAAAPRAELRVLANMNHVLKDVASDDRAANLATYADASRPLAPGLVDAIAAFVKQ